LIEFYEFERKLGRSYYQQGKKIFRMWIFNKLEIGLSSSKLMEIVMTHPKFISKSSQYSYLHDALGEGLLFSTNQKWFARRRIITPTFHFKILEQFFDIFKKHNLMLMDKIEERADGRIFDIFPIVTVSVIDSLCETAMGCEMNSENHEYLNAVKELSVDIATRFLTPWMRIEFLYNFSANKRNIQRNSKIMHDLTIKVIETRREKLQKELNNKTNTDDEIGLKKKMCLLDVLLQSTVDGVPLSNDDIQEEVDTFTFAGHDTTANVICFTLFMIAKHPEVQKKLFMEIQEIVGDDDVSFSIVNELKYLDMVIKETMRIHPPVPIVSRRLHEQVEVDGYTFPANANYNLSFITLFNDPHEFEEPEKFIPERFMKPLKTPYSFIPFSAVRN
jgi:cytochrome P450 family 4